MPVEIDVIRTQLEQRLQELESRLHHIQQDQIRSHSADFAEQAQERENDEVVDGIGTETRESIQHIKQALQRIASGDYGICQACGQDIAPARLKILPDTVYCVGCADSH